VFGTFSNLALEISEGVAQEYTLRIDEDPADADKPRTTYKAAKEEDNLLGGQRSEGCVRQPVSTPAPRG
jgi:hypothetical protein